MPQTPLATGPLMVPLSKLADMLAALTSVQARFGTPGNVPATLERVFFPMLEDEQAQTAQDTLRVHLPCIVVGCGDKWSLKSVAGGHQNFLFPDQAGNSIRLLLGDKTRYEDRRSAYIDFGNWAGAVCQQLADVAAEDDNLAIMNIRQQTPPMLCSKEEENSGGLYFTASFFVDWQ
jgi:hypothetical protein